MKTLYNKHIHCFQGLFHTYPTYRSNIIHTSVRNRMESNECRLSSTRQKMSLKCRIQFRHQSNKPILIRNITELTHSLQTEDLYQTCSQSATGHNCRIASVAALEGDAQYFIIWNIDDHCLNFSIWSDLRKLVVKIVKLIEFIDIINFVKRFSILA